MKVQAAEIRIATLEDILPVRHQVLWPNDSIESCLVEGDESALHIAAYIKEKIVCVASLYEKKEHEETKGYEETKGHFRLRKFATLTAYQKQGIGSQVLTFIIKMLEEKEAQLFWCDAREDALPFYKRFHFNVVGERFTKRGRFYYKIERSINQSF